MRLLRSTTVAVATLLIAVAGHTIAGGAAPGAILAASLFAVIGSAALLLSHRRFELRALVAVLILGQALVHLSCTFAAAPAAGTSDLVMLVLHGLATAVTAAVLRCGDAFLWRVAEILGISVVSFLCSTQKPFNHSRPSLPVLGSPRVPRALHFGSTRFDRGPPVWLPA